MQCAREMHVDNKDVDKSMIASWEVGPVRGLHAIALSNVVHRYHLPDSHHEPLEQLLALYLVGLPTK
jgi:hypothetical protein